MVVVARGSMAGFPCDAPHLCVPDVLNNVPYCAHERDMCHFCCQTPAQARATRIFKLPETGVPEYPAGLADIRDDELRKLVARRWLEMQQALFRREEPRPLKLGVVKLPAAEVTEEVRTTSLAQHACLVQHFQQLLEMAAEQRYFYANQATIMLNSYETFAQAAVLYEKVLVDIRSCVARFCGRDLGNTWRSKGTIITTLAYFLSLESQRTFWASLEATMEVFLQYLENYDEALDGKKVIEGQAKGYLLDCVGHMFWAVTHAQYQVDQLRRQQHVDFQHQNKFPFYPYRVKKALEEGLDVHVLIARLSTYPLHDFPLFSSVLASFKQACEYREQMQDVNVEVMAAIDELSTRFRVTELLISAGSLVAKPSEIRSAILFFKFNPKGQEVISATEDLALLSSRGAKKPPALPEHGRLSMLQDLLVKEAMTRRKNLPSFMCDPLLSWETAGLTVEMFEAFKSQYNSLYYENIRPEFETLVRSVLPLETIRRLQQRKEAAKKKRTLSIKDRIKAALRGDRAVPKLPPVNPDLFWEVGDWSLEKYVLEPVREKIKTRKQGDVASDSEASDGGSSLVSIPKSISDQTTKSDESTPVLRPVKDTDLRTRDILWRRVKGTLKWSNLVQLLTRLGCYILNLDGSKKKVVDRKTGRCTVLHRPHPGDDCRPDQRDSYREHLEDWLKINYAHIVPAAEKEVEQTDNQAPAENGSVKPQL